jgi:lipoyl(octanoyl) transferase
MYEGHARRYVWQVVPLHGFWLGRRDFVATYRLQCQLMEARKRGEIGDVVLLLEHPPTITLGRGAHSSNLLASEQSLQNLGVELYRTDRGGDITLHAPGQLVVYPILSLIDGQRDVRRYVRTLSETMKRLIARHGICGGMLENLIGVWVDQDHIEHWQEGQPPARPAKVGAIGVRISRWVTMHGFALNLTTDLDLFRLIIPCGISHYSVTSTERLVGVRTTPRDEASAALAILGQLLERRVGELQLLDEPSEPIEVLAAVTRAAPSTEA